LETEFNLDPDPKLQIILDLAGSRSTTLKRIARKGQPEWDRQNRTARTGLPGEDRQDRTARTGPPGQDRQDRTARTGPPGQVCQDRAARIMCFDSYGTLRYGTYSLKGLSHQFEMG
jgi:hypothetical protein